MKAGKYLESKNGKYRLDFQNSGLHLSCGVNTIWRFGFSHNTALYLDLEGLSLVLLNSRTYDNTVFYKSATIWNASTVDRAKKLFLQDDGNLVLSDDNNKTTWETKTSGACPTGLEELTFKYFLSFLKLPFVFQVKIRQEQ